MAIIYGSNYKGKKLGKQYQDKPTQNNASEFGVLTDEQAKSIGLETDKKKLLSTVPRTSGGGRPQTFGDVMLRGQTASTTPSSLRASRANRTVAGKTANSAGSFYGKAGTSNLATSFGTDAAGNSILGSLGGRNIIGGRVAVDRTAGVPGNPLEEYMAMLSPQSVIDRQKQARRELERERQGQMDAIREKYKAQVADEQAAGAEDLARMRSMNLRAGLGGSDFGAANKIGVRDRTQRNVRAIEANADIEIGNVLNNIEQLAQARSQQEQQAMQQGFSNMFQFQQFNQQQQQQQRAQAVESIAQLGKSGLDIATIKERDPQLYENLAAASGMGEVELEAVLNNNKPAPQQVDYQWKVVGGKILGYGVDPVTGTLKTLEQEVDMPDNYKITTMPDGTVLGIPENWDGDKNKIMTVGNYAKPTSGGGGGAVGGATGNGLVGVDGKPLKLTATQTEALAGYDNTVQASQDALTLLQSGVQTGPVAGRMMALGKLTGNVDENQLRLEQLLGKIKADFMKAMSGAAVSEQEVQRLSKFLPDMNDQEPVIESKLNTLQQEVARSKQNLLNTLGAVQQSTAEVEVRSPDGTIGTIPADQLQQALAEGYTQL